MNHFWILPEAKVREAPTGSRPGCRTSGQRDGSSVLRRNRRQNLNIQKRRPPSRDTGQFRLDPNQDERFRKQLLDHGAISERTSKADCSPAGAAPIRQSPVPWNQSEADKARGGAEEGRFSRRRRRTTPPSTEAKSTELSRKC